MAELSPISISNLSNRIHFSPSPTTISFHSFKITGNRSNKCTNISRRLGLGLIALMASSVATSPVKMATALDLKLIAPEQSFEEAESGIRSHAEALLQVRGLIESESWKEAQKQLRSSSPLLKQDLYTIIEYKPPAERPPLRKLYSVLFNNVTRVSLIVWSSSMSLISLCVWSEITKNFVLFFFEFVFIFGFGDLQMDYAARDKDAERVWQCYNNIVMAISDILSRI